MASKEEIENLILGLHVNERPEIYSGTSEPNEPIETISRLIEISHDAVPRLIEELKQFRKEGESRYYPEYIVTILGEIGDPRAIDELIEITHIDFDTMDLHEKSIMALAKIGNPAVSYYLDKIKKEKSDSVIFDALWVFALLKEHNENVLDFAKSILLQHKNDEYKVTAIEIIGNQGTQKETQMLEEFLDHDYSDMVHVATTSIRKLLKDNPAKLRKILIEHRIIGKKRSEETGRKLERAFNSLAFTYDRKEKLAGGSSDDLNEAVREYYSVKTMIETLYEISKFGVDEGVLTDDDENKILDVWRKLHERQNEVEDQYTDVISLFDYYFRRNVNPRAQSFRSFKDLYPVPNDLKLKIKKWLEMEGFQINDITFDYYIAVNYAILARIDSKKSCIVSFNKTEGKRKYGNVELRIIGENWSEKEIEKFQNGVWNLFKDLENLV